MRIGIDGYNLAMPLGTGIATYGYVLGDVLNAAGIAVDGIFGLDAGRDASLYEARFFEQLGNSETRPVLRKAGRRALYRSALSPFAANLIDVPLTDRVDKQPLAQRIPPFSAIYTRQHLFEIANRHFNIYGRFLNVRVSRPPDIMHWTYPVPIKLIGSRNIYTMHDLIPLRLPYMTLDNKRHYRRLVERCAAEGAQICTVSETSAADIADQLQIDGSRISNCYQASPFPDHEQNADGDAETRNFLKQGFGLDWKEYFLYFGAIEPKKNVGRLLQGYLASGVATKLLIVSSRAWQSDEDMALLKDASGQHGAGAGAVIHLEHAPRPVLRRIVRGARAVLFPSLFEGFGLPVLEALQQGVPVMTSNRGSLPEVAGDAALFVDPYSVEQIADACRKLDTDDALRSSLAARGPRRAATFSRQRFLDRLQTMYDKVLQA